MSFEAKSLLILGRQPAIGLAELESLYGADRLRPLDQGALLNIEAGDVNFNRLGGTLKVAQLLTTLPTNDWDSALKYLADNIPKHLENLPSGTFTLGLSVYGLEVKLGKLSADLLSLKKTIKATGKSTRIVPNKSLELNSAQVLHNNLTKKGAWELLLVRDGQRTHLAQTFFVQDIDAYAARDQARPKRDARVGMLPPKLAQILINLAIAGKDRQHLPDGRTRPVRVLDPFCGTGVVLQEALLMGYHVIGSDLEPRMVDYSKANVQWLFAKYPNLAGQVVIETADATDHVWPRFSVVATEIYLGRALSALPPMDKLQTIIQDANMIAKKFLKNLHGQLQPGQRLALAVPAWRTKSGLRHLPLLENLKGLGYNRLDFDHVKNDELVYFREDQVVARELLVLEKAKNE